MHRAADGVGYALLSGKAQAGWAMSHSLISLKRFRQSVDPDVPWAGFYAFGEVGPVEEHNNRNLYTSVVFAPS
jgi:small ligand-binding sensory domain FIST